MCKTVLLTASEITNAAICLFIIFTTAKVQRFPQTHLRRRGNLVQFNIL